MQTKHMVLAALLFLVCGLGVASAETHIPAGTVSAYNMNTAGETYILDGDVSATASAFTVGANNITFDGQNYTVTYATSSSGIGITSNTRSGVAIKNVIVRTTNTSTSGAYAVYLAKTNTSVAQNINATSVGCAAIYITDSTGTTIKDCVTVSASAQTLKAATVTNVTIQNCSGVSTSNNGVYLSSFTSGHLLDLKGSAESNVGFNALSTTNTEFVNCTGISSSNYGLFLGTSSANNTFTNCTGNSTTSHGFGLRDVRNNILTQCRGYSSTGNGLMIYTNATGCTLTECYGYTAASSNDRSGVHIESNNTTLINCSAYAPDIYGLYTVNCTNVSSTGGNWSSGSSFGAYIYTTSNSAFTSEHMSSVSGDGVCLNYANNSTFNDCLFTSDELKGTRIKTSIGNTFTECTATSPRANTGYHENNILIMGDSISEGYPDVENGGWGVMLGDLLNTYDNKTYHIQNQANSGEESGNARKCFEAVLDLYTPDQIIMMWGTNDVNHGVPEQDTIDAILWMANEAKSRDIDVIIQLSPAEDAVGNPSIIALDQNLSTQATAAGFTVVSMYDMIDSIPGNAQYDSFVAEYYVDTAHPNNVSRPMIALDLWKQFIPATPILNKNVEINSNGEVVTEYGNSSVNLIPFDAIPDVGTVNVTVSSWSANQKVWVESSENPTTVTNHTMGNFPSNTTIQIKRDGVNYEQVTSNATGYINWTYSGGYSEHTFEATPAGSVTITVTSHNFLNSASENASNLELSETQTSSGFSGLYQNVRSSISSGYSMATLMIIALAAAGIMRYLGFL